MSNRKHFLISPLNWGLGHASRCVPIIENLLDRGQKVTLAADGRSLAYLRRQFPDLETLEAPGYGISYPESGIMAISMAVQIPRILQGVRREQRWLAGVTKEHEIDIVISDNRFGMRSNSAYNIYMTHQVRILCPPHLSGYQSILNRIHKRVISRFDECWIPDYPDHPNLSGDLSHGFTLPENARFIGLLSQLRRIRRTSKEYDLAVILSGPEPQRTIFERIVLEQASGLPVKTIVIRGMPEHAEREVRDNLTLVSHLTAAEMNDVFATSKVVLARPGYSTIMDLSVMGNSAILIPTPGQTEQEYLAKRSSNERLFLTQSQSEFDLKSALEQVDDYTGIQWSVEEGELLRVQLDRISEIDI